MKLIIQIPCYNEEKTLPLVIKSIPKKIDGIDKIEILVIDDGSSDRTSEVAMSLGVDYIKKHHINLGLAKAFSSGILGCLEAGADIIVNIDADNQYCAEDIPNLIKPILENKADFVIGIRPIDKIAHFSFTKKQLQKLGSYVVSKIAGVNIQDVTSGFRAISKDAAMKLNLFSMYTYTLETIIQSLEKDIRIMCVPIRVNSPTRRSRLMKNTFDYVMKSVLSLLRLYLYYRPIKFFSILGGVIFSCGFVLGLRFIYFYFIGQGRGHIQSLILASILLIIGFNILILGLISSLISLNRKMIEKVYYLINKSINR